MLSYDENFYLETERSIQQFNRYLIQLKEVEWSLNIHRKKERALYDAFYVWVNCVGEESYYIPKSEFQMLYSFSFELISYIAKHELTNDFIEANKGENLSFKLFVYSLSVCNETRKLFEAIVKPELLNLVDEMSLYANDIDLIEYNPKFEPVFELRKNMYNELRNGYQLQSAINRHIYEGFRNTNAFFIQHSEYK